MYKFQIQVFFFSDFSLVFGLVLALVVIILFCICTIVGCVTFYRKCGQCCRTTEGVRIAPTVAPITPVDPRMVLVPLSQYDQPNQSRDRTSSNDLPPPYDPNGYTYIRKDEKFAKS